MMGILAMEGGSAANLGTSVGNAGAIGLKGGTFIALQPPPDWALLPVEAPSAVSPYKVHLFLRLYKLIKT
jgi:hypothetical protein